MPPRIRIIGSEDKTVPYLNWAKRQWLLRSCKWYKSTDDCLIEFFRNGDYGYINLIAEPSGFICHPRTSDSIVTVKPFGDSYRYTDYSIVGGYGYDTEKKQIINLDTNYLYPLIDTDNASFVASDTAMEHVFEAGSYGNIYWTNGIDIISYKGTPSRHGVLSEGIAGIDALSGMPFGYYFYQKGVVLAASPNNNPILGGAIIDGVLVGIFAFEANPLKRYIDKKWVDIPVSGFNSNYFYTQWWFSSDGKHAATDNSTISISDWAAVQTVHPMATATVSIAGQYSSQSKNISYNGTAELWHEYSDVLKFADVTVSNTFNSSDTTVGTTEWLQYDYPHLRKTAGTYAIVTIMPIDGGLMISARTDQDPVGCEACWNYDLGGLIEIENYGCSILARVPSECRSSDVTFVVTATGTGGNTGMSATASIDYPATPGTWIDVINYTNPYDWYTCGVMSYCDPATTYKATNTAWVQETIADNHLRVASTSCTGVPSPNCGCASSDRPSPGGLTGVQASSPPSECWKDGEWVSDSASCVSFLASHYRREFRCL